jgi:hypothetical protein
LLRLGFHDPLRQPFIPNSEWEPQAERAEWTVGQISRMSLGIAAREQAGEAGSD